MFKKRRRHGFQGVIKVALAASLVWGGFEAYQKIFVFNPENILEKSELKNNKFNVEVKDVTSPRNHLKAYLFEEKTNPIISVSFIFKNAGLASDDKGKVGVSNMVASLLTYGAGELDVSAFHDELENNAISLSFDVNKDDFVGSLLTTKENASKAFDLLKKVLMNARFDRDNIEHVRRRMLMALQQQSEQPENLLGLAFADALFENHPYARNPLGAKKDIESLTQADLKEFVKRHFSQGNLVVGIAGDISQEEAETMLDDVFGDLPQSGSINFVRPAEVNFAFGRKDIETDSAQNISRFASLGVERLNPDFYPLYVANYIFGGSGLSSRLNVMAREKQGLTYGVYSYLDLADKASMIVGGFSSTPENFDKVIEIVQGEWLKFAEKGISEKELEDAKNYLISSYNLRFASIADLADIMAYMQKDNLGIDFLQKRNSYIENVRLDDVNRVIKKYFNKDKLVFVNVGKF